MIEIESHPKGQPAYCAYTIDGDGKIKSATPILAMDDKEAVKLAYPLVDHCAIELWDRGRKVIRLPPCG